MTDEKKTPSTDTPEDKAFAALDTAKLKQELTPDIQKMVDDGIAKGREQDREEMKKDMARSLTGDTPDKYAWDKRGDKKPSGWDEVTDEVGKKLDIDKRIDDKLAKSEDQRKKQTELQTQQTANQRKQLMNRWDDQVYALQVAGAVPSYSKEIQEKIDKGTMLTQDDWSKDKGLKARRELFQIAVDNGYNPTQAFKNVWSKQPKGAYAPVFGGAGAPSGKEDEYSLEDTAKLAGKPLPA